jgi:hypothetical protein
MIARIGPDLVTKQAERHQHRLLQHEWFLNSIIAAGNPHLASTPRYQRGALPASDPRFYCRLDYLRYLTRRERGRFDPDVDYPTLPPVARVQPAPAKSGAVS